MQLVLGTRKSRLEDNGFPTQDVGHDLALAFLIFTMALLAFWAGELLAEAIAVRKGRDAGRPLPADRAALGDARDLLVPDGRGGRC